MENFVSIALLLIVKVAERTRSLASASLASRAPDDRPLPLPPATFAAEPAHQ